MLVKLQNIPFEVEYHSYQGAPGTREIPPDPPEFWLTSVCLDGYELIEMLTDQTIDALESKAIEQLMDDEP